MIAKPIKATKTRQQKLKDLDDHLGLLRHYLHEMQRDQSFIKPISATLRVLVCKSRIEGLLWRLTNDLSVDDRVHIHSPLELDRKNPLTRGSVPQISPYLRRWEQHGCDRSILQYLGEFQHEWLEAAIWHCGDQLVEHAALTE